MPKFIRLIFPKINFALSRPKELFFQAGRQAYMPKVRLNPHRLFLILAFLFWVYATDCSLSRINSAEKSVNLQKENSDAPNLKQ